MNFDSRELIMQMPDISYLLNSTELSFRGCDNLVEVHDSVGFLDKLKFLRVCYCSKLKIFPPIKLPNLEILEHGGIAKSLSFS